MTVHPSEALARVLVDELVRNGVRDAVLSPGSRNAPLSLALVAADTAGRLRLHVRVDERTAGFLALGLARGSGRPVPVVTTSGTAVANLHPAVLEAHHTAVPLLVLSADRPPELRHVGANQVVDQPGIFGSATRFVHEFGVPARRDGQQAGWRAVVCRAVAAAVGAAGLPGPVQLDVPFVEPLLPGGDDGAEPWPEPLDGRDGPWVRVAGVPVPGDPAAGDGTADDPGGSAGPAVPPPAPGERVLFLADLEHPAAGAVAALGHPVVAEAGGAAGAAVLSTGVHLLGLPDWLAEHRPDRVVVLGRLTLHRPLTALLRDARVAVDVVAPVTAWPDPAGLARRVAPRLARIGPVGPTGDADWAARWRRAEDRAAPALAAAVAALDPGAGPRLAAELVRALPSGTDLVLGSSQGPRDVGLASAARDGLRIRANRGVAGIDGTISTAAGHALGSGRPTVALVGDLTFLHDVTGLFVGPAEPRPDLVLVVADNGGGGIFHTLEPGRPAHAAVFERVFGTPVQADPAALARAAGAEVVDLARAATGARAELADAVRPGRGLRVVRVRVERSDLRAQHAGLRAAVARAVGAGG
ncbi:2-succinyl-5-enolpyruvyl-6-hydroxy-3-cyclohexene-1-carboxylic-acid synthase [Nakamurella endophytica]|uniref:2-succinyl-5-enolpyruvyl-6-hydroxy-3-cyclohexene-1-carboxylate synthase n=1 Tax=Nakamurella endophytica TaxID=1748367 RepID=A0A917SYH1_9ACTN|nr:2-succinyl-5-enolpyruvyl-6-hydroxy-3-cyclohexene-1-carboxylic-acid synthase [Nakamurella endophytica]GGM03845.1 2-succinyl-5-enolpyruvyl-6-hydroxy-3-cyclohexene-1-carboxylate synthase [Nakamurella endophytica]